MKRILPPPVTPSDEETIAAGGWHRFVGLKPAMARPIRWGSEEISIFTAARDAVGSEEPIAMGGW